MQIFAHCKQCFYSFMWYTYKIKVKKLITCTLWYCFNLKRIIFTLNKLNVISEFHHACLRQNQNFISLSSLAWGKALIMLCTIASTPCACKKCAQVQCNKLYWGITLNLVHCTWFVPQISLKTGHKSLFEHKLYWYKGRSLLDWQNLTWGNNRPIRESHHSFYHYC